MDSGVTQSRIETSFIRNQEIRSIVPYSSLEIEDCDRSESAERDHKPGRTNPAQNQPSKKVGTNL